MSEDSPDSAVTAAALALLSPLAAHNASLNTVSASSPGLQQFMHDVAADAEEDQTNGRVTTARRSSLQHHQRKGRKVTRACDACKARKARCSGTIPCDRCTRKGTPSDCHYDARYRRGRPVEPIRVSVTAASSHVDGGDMKRRKRESASSIEVAPVHLGSHDSNGAACAVMSPPSESSVRFDDARIGRHSYNDDTTNDIHQPAIRGDTAAPSRASPELDVAEIQGQYYDTTSGLAFLHRALRRFSKNNRHDAEKEMAPTTNPKPTKPGNSSHDTRLPSTNIPSNGPEQTTTSEDSPTFTAGDRPLEPPQTPISHLSLPSLSRTLDLVNLYFESSIATFRVLHLPTVRRWVSTLLSNSTSELPLHTTIGKAKASIVLLILAIATAHEDRCSGVFIQDEAASMRQSDGFFSAASLLLEQETSQPTLASAQARLVQVLYLLNTSRFNQAWYVFGTVNQLISALGLHRRVRHRATKPNSNTSDMTKARNTTQDNYIDLQLRRRTFWTAYILDKYLGVMFGRPAHYNDDDIDQEMPSNINDEDMTEQGPRISSLPISSNPHNGEKDCHVSALIHHARLAQVVSEATRCVYSIRPSIGPKERIDAATRLNGELRQWQNGLPPYLGGAVRPSSLIPVFRRQAVALRINFSHARLHINRLFLLGSLGTNASSTNANCTSHESSGEGGPSAGSGGRDSGDFANDQSGGNEENQEKLNHIQEAILAAHEVLETVDQMVTEQGDNNSSLFYALWWTQYVTFCALATVYAWNLQARRFRLPLYDDGDGGHDNSQEGTRRNGGGGGEARKRLMELADRCIGHLARATASNSPSRRYAIILDKMRREVKKQQQREAMGSINGQSSTKAAAVGRTAAGGRTPAVERQVFDARGADRVGRNDFYYQNNNDDDGSGNRDNSGVELEKSAWEEPAYGVGQHGTANGDFQHYGSSGGMQAHHDGVGFGFMPGSALGDNGFGNDEATILGTSPSTGYGSSLDGMNWSVQEWQTEDWLNLDAIAFTSFLDS